MRTDCDQNLPWVRADPATSAVLLGTILLGFSLQIDRLNSACVHTALVIHTLMTFEGHSVQDVCDSITGILPLRDFITFIVFPLLGMSAHSALILHCNSQFSLHVVGMC